MSHSIFITGIAGFIGFHTALALKKLGMNVYGCDNFNDYYDVTLKRLREQKLLDANIPVFAYDISDTKSIKALLQDNKTSHVIHLAAQAGVRYSLENPMSYIDTNVKGFTNLLETIKDIPGIKLIYASSSSVYGLNNKVPFSEKDRTDSPASLYAATKKMKELLAHTYHNLYQIPMLGLRFFTVYGPFGRPDMAYFHFTKAIDTQKTIDVYQNGLLMRDFTYIDDIVNGIVSSIDAPFSYEICNLGNKKKESVNTLVSLVEKHLGKKAKINFAPFQKGDVIQTFADIEKAQNLLGFNPKTSLDEGISKFISWYQEYKSQA